MHPESYDFVEGNLSAIQFAKLFDVKENIALNHISEENLKAIRLIKSFGDLSENWDSYGAARPSQIAVQKAVAFVVLLAEYELNVFFSAPSPNGDILIELKSGDARVEFEFSGEVSDSVSAWYQDELHAEAELNDTTKKSYIKWSICPDGNCPPNL